MSSSSSEPTHNGTGLIASLLSWRTRPSFGPVEAIVLLLFVASVSITIPWHERSIDEAQAWLISSDNSLWQIFRYRLHYEGAPGLWHLILHIFHALHGTYNGINWLGAAFAAAGVFVLLRYSPFPLLIRALLPLTFFLQYQYAVVARGYTLFPLLVFTLCTLFPRKDKILWFTAVAAILANLSFQGVMVGLTLSVLFLYDLQRHRPTSAGVKPRLPAAKLGLAGAIYFSALCLSAYTAFPAPDISFPAGGPVAYSSMHAALVRFLGEAPRIEPDTPHPFFLRPADLQRPSPFRHPALWAAWQVSYRPAETPALQQSGLLEGDPAKFPRFGPQSTLGAALEFLFGLFAQITWPLATFRFLACVFVAMLIFWLFRRRALRSLLPWLAVIFLGQVLWVADHHAGMIFVALLAGIWLTPSLGGSRPASPVLERSFLLLFALILALQLSWSAYAIHADIHTSYDPGPETAAFLKANPIPRTAAFRFHTVSIEPYFGHPPFTNIPHRYWLWSANNDPELQLFKTIESHPDRIVYARESPGNELMRNTWAPLTRLPSAQEERDLPWDLVVIILHRYGYQETHRFCGSRFSRLGSSYIACDLIFEPAPQSRPNRAP